MSNRNIKWSARRMPDGSWAGEATVRIDPGAGAPAAITASARGSSRADAAARTFRALDAVTRSPLVRSLLPPGAGAAIDAARTVASTVARLFRRRRRTAPASAAMSGRDVARVLARRGADRRIVRLAGSL